MNDYNKKIRELLEKQNREWTILLLNFGKMMQESHRLLNFFYRDFVVFNTKPKLWQFWKRWKR